MCQLLFYSKRFLILYLKEKHTAVSYFQTTTIKTNYIWVNLKSNNGSCCTVVSLVTFTCASIFVQLELFCWHLSAAQKASATIIVVLKCQLPTLLPVGKNNMLLLKIQYRNMFFNAPVCMCAAYEIHKLQSRVLQTHFL